MRWRDVTPGWWDRDWTEAKAAVLVASLLATDDIATVLADVEGVLVKVHSGTTNADLEKITKSD